MADYIVKRQHRGDRRYSAGDTRRAQPRDVAHLVAAGVLEEKAAAPAQDKAVRAPKNKAAKPVENKADV